MARLTNEISIDVSDFIKGLTLAQQETIKLGQELKDLQETKVADPFDQLVAQSKIAKAKVDELRKQLKAAIITGDAEGIKSLKIELAKATKESDNFAKSIEEVNKQAGEAAKGSASAFNIFQTAVGSAIGGGVAGIIQGATTKIIEFGKVAFEEYKKLDTAINNIGTLGVEAAGLSLDRFKELATELSTSLPDTAGNIANGIYNAISAGITGTEEEIAGFVEQAGKVAVAGLSDTNTAVNALTSVVNAYGLGAQGAKKVSDIFFATIKAGKTSFEELNAGLSNVVPAASAAGISFEEVGATIAKLTTVGIPTAQATTQLRAVIVELQKPGAELAKVLEKAGLSGAELQKQLAKPVEEGGGLVNVLQRVDGAAKGLGKNLTQVFSSTEASSAALSVTGKNAASSIQILGNVIEDVKAGVSEDAFGAASKSLDVQIKIFENNIQAAFNTIFSAVIPVIETVIGIFTDTLAPAIEDFVASFKEYFGNLATILKPILAVIGGVIIANIVVAIQQVLAVAGILYDTLNNVFSAVADALTPVAEAFGLVGDKSSESIDFVGAFKEALLIIGDVIKTVAEIFTGVLAVGIEIATIPLSIIGDVAAGVIGWFKDLFGATEDTSKSFQKSVPIIEQVRNALEFIRNASQGVVNIFRELKSTLADFVNALGNLDIAGAIEAFTGFGDRAADAYKKAFEKPAKDATEATENLGKAAEETGKKVDEQANKTGKLGKSTKGAKDEITKLTAELAKLRREQEKAAELEDANRIADATERQLKILDIERKYSRIGLEEELAAVKGNSKAAILQREILNARLLNIDTDFAKRRNNVLNAVAVKQFEEQQQLAKQTVASSLAINQTLIDELEKQTQVGNVGAVSSLIAATRKQVETELSQSVDAVVESTPDFKKAYDEIKRQLSSGFIDTEQAQKQLDELRQSILTTLLADPGDSSEFAGKIAELYDKAAEKITESERTILDAAEERRIARISSDLLRSVEERVRSLQKEREILLENTELTKEQRDEIEKGFGDAIDKVRREPLRTFGQALEGIAGTIAGLQFDLNVEEQTQAAQALQSETDAINEALRAGEISYQEAIDKLAELEQQAQDTTSQLGTALTTALTQVANSAREQVAGSLENLQSIRDQIAKTSEDITLTTDERNKQLTALNGKLAEQQDEIFAQIGLSAATAFGAALAEGQNVGEALKGIIADTARSLLAVYTPTIIAAFASIIPGPPGLIAGGLAVASLQALLSAALAGFKDGGYTGNVGTNEIAGIVHGREFVVNAQATAKYRDVLEAMNNGKPFDLVSKDKRSNTFVDITGGLNNVASILTDVRDRLDRIPDSALMKQQIGIDVALDDKLFERQRYRKQVRGLR